MRIRTCTLLAASLFLGAGCGDGDTPTVEPTPGPITVEVRGTVARDSVVRVRVLNGTDSVAPGEYTLAATPDSIVQRLGGDSLRLVAPGVLRLTATFRGVEGSTQLTVPVPPPLQVNLLGTMARDSVVRVLVRSGPVEVTSGVTLQATPAASVQLLGGDSLRLLVAGPLTVRATRGRDTGSVAVTVAAQPPLAVTVSGRLRRGSVARVQVRRAAGGTLLPDAAVTFAPADAVEGLGGDSVRLLRDGALQVRAVAGQDTGVVTVGVDPAPPLVLSATGRARRGSVLRFGVMREGAALAPGEAPLTFIPADAVQPLGGDSVRLLRDGALQVRAATRFEEGQATFSVEASPPLVLSAVGRARRGSVVRIRVERDGAALAEGGAALAFTPADAVQPLGGDSVRLLRDGALQVRATTQFEEGQATLTVEASPPLVVSTSGRAERGLVLRVRVEREGETLAPGAATLAFTPADAVQALGGDSVRLLRVGALEVRATTTFEAGTRSVTVATPPSLVFDRLVSGNRDIWRVALDGADLVRLTDDPGEDNDPTVAGTRVVFVSYRVDRNAELFTAAVGGGAATRLTRTAANETMPALSPNGQRLAYALDNGGLSKLYLANGDGTGAARASSLGGDYALDTSPSWFADNARLVFMSTTNGNADLFSFAPPAAPVTLTPGSATDVEPAVAPDGDRVVFSSVRGGNAGQGDLYLLRISTGAITRLTTSANSEGQPAWTADGRVVYTEFVNGAGVLRWLDPESPGVVHTIATGTGSARNPALIP